MGDIYTVGRITFSATNDSQSWGLDDNKDSLVFANPAEAKKAEKLFNDMQRELASLRAEKERAERERDEAVNKMQRGWLEVTESGINHYKQRAERAEADAKQQREALSAAVQDVHKLEAERDAAVKDAEKMRQFIASAFDAHPNLDLDIAARKEPQ